LRKTGLKAKQTKRQKFLEKIGMKEDAMGAVSEVLGKKGVQKFGRGVGKTVSGTGFTATGVVTGAVAGAAIGSAVPVIGTAIGGVIGGLFGGGAGLASYFGRQALRYKGMTPDQREKRMNEDFNIGNITEQATKKGSENIQNAKKEVTHAKNSDWVRDASGSTFYSSGGQTDRQKKFFEQLTSSSHPDAGNARNNITDWINRTGAFVNTTDPMTGNLKINGFNADKDGDVNKVRGLAKGIAAFRNGGYTGNELDNIVTAINDQVTPVNDDTKLKNVDQYKDSVTANRKTKGGVLRKDKNSKAIKGDMQLGQLQAKNNVGVDFRDINQAVKSAGVSDFEANQEGLHLKTPELISAVSKRMNELIDGEMKKLENLRSTKGILPDDYLARKKTLDGARDKFKNPSQITSLDLVNTGLTAKKGEMGYIGEREKTDIHERLHTMGMTNETKIEEFAEKIQSKGLFAHVDEIGRLAAQDEPNANFTKIEHMAKVNAKTKQSAQDVIIREQAGAPAAAAGAAAPTAAPAVAVAAEKERLVAEVPQMNDLLKAVQDLKPSEAKEAGIQLQFAPTPEGAVSGDQKYYGVINVLTAINKGLASMGTGLGRVGSSLADISTGVNRKSTPLDVKVTAEAVEDALKK